MRVISGLLGGRTFESPGGHRTHPMSERTRGALFNILGDISGMNVFDPYSGTGALSIEAISRGARFSVMIDLDKNAYKTMTDNVNALDIAHLTKIIRANAVSWSERNPNEYFDLVLLDPPYDDIKQSHIERLVLHTRAGGVSVLSLPPKIAIRLPGDFETLALKSYGDSTLHIFRRIA